MPVEEAVQVVEREQVVTLQELLEMEEVRVGGEQAVASLITHLLKDMAVRAAEARNEPVTRWRCEECGKEFSERCYLYLHTRLHVMEPEREAEALRLELEGARASNSAARYLYATMALLSDP